MIVVLACCGCKPNGITQAVWLHLVTLFKEGKVCGTALEPNKPPIKPHTIVRPAML
jgi:hypothetical protein